MRGSCLQGEGGAGSLGAVPCSGGEALGGKPEHRAKRRLHHDKQGGADPCCFIMHHQGQSKAILILYVSAPAACERVLPTCAVAGLQLYGAKCPQRQGTRSSCYRRPCAQGCCSQALQPQVGQENACRLAMHCACQWRPGGIANVPLHKQRLGVACQVKAHGQVFI